MLSYASDFNALNSALLQLPMVFCSAMCNDNLLLPTYLLSVTSETTLECSGLSVETGYLVSYAEIWFMYS